MTLEQKYSSPLSSLTSHMPNLTIVVWIVAVSFLWIPQSLVSANGNESTTDSSQSAPDKKNTFKLPERKTRSASKSQQEGIKSLVGDTGIKIGIVLGILAIAVLVLAKRKDTHSIPREAIEILGQVPMSARQSVQLIRFGQKLVLVESAATGLKPISEITDPAEVERMLDLIQSRGR